MRVHYVSKILHIMRVHYVSKILHIMRVHYVSKILHIMRVHYVSKILHIMRVHYVSKILHIMRVHYVSKIWKSSLESIMSLPPIENLKRCTWLYFSCTMFNASSSCISHQSSKMWVSHWMLKKLQLPQKPNILYRIV